MKHRPKNHYYAVLLNGLISVFVLGLMPAPVIASEQGVAGKEPTHLLGSVIKSWSAKHLDDNDGVTFVQLTPGTSVTRQRTTTPSGGPVVTASTPNIRVVTKGAGYASITFTGGNLNKVRSVSVINAGGRVERGFTAIVNSRGRTDNRLNIGVLAGPTAAEGSFDIRLNFERPQTTPNATKNTPLYARVPSNYGRFSVRSLRTSVSLSPNPNVAGKLTYQIINVDGVPGNQVTQIRRWGAVGSGWGDGQGTIACWYNVYMSVRKVVTCDSPNAGQRKTSSLRERLHESGQILPVALGTSFDFKREANACYEMARETYSSKWLAPNRLQIRMPNGEFEHPRLGYTQGASCLMRFTIDTKDAAGNDWRIYTDNATLQFK